MYFSYKNKHLLFFIIAMLPILLLVSIIYDFNIHKKNTTFEIKDNNQTEKYLEAILKAYNSEKINKNFQNIIDKINLQAINYYSKKIHLSTQENKKAIEEYYNKRNLIIKDIHKTMKFSKNYRNRYDIKYKYYDSTQSFSESISSFVCGIASLSFLAKAHKVTQNNLIKYVAIKPSCRKVLTNVVLPFTQYLKNKAIIKDINEIKLELEKRVRTSILKLATAKDTYYYRVHDNFTRVIDLYVTKTYQKTTISANVKSIVIAGFDLTNFKMKINHKTKILSIYLDKPKIISNDVNIDFENPEKEFLSPEINSKMYNNLYLIAKNKSLEEAKEQKIFNEAKKNAYIAIMNIFQPLMELPQFNYKVRVLFEEESYNPDTEF